MIVVTVLTTMTFDMFNVEATNSWSVYVLHSAMRVSRDWGTGSTTLYLLCPLPGARRSGQRTIIWPVNDWWSDFYSV